MLALIIAVATVAAPFEFVVDCSGWQGNGKCVLTCRYECWDGRVIEEKLTLPLRSTPPQLVNALELSLEWERWRYERFCGPLTRPGNEEVFVIRGSKTSLIKDVAFKGDLWAPVVTRRIATTPTPMPKK